MVLLENYSIPTEALKHTEANVFANVDNSEVGTGTLFITENYVLWLNSNNEGIQLEYKQITLHAISRDLQAFPREHLLLHYEGKISRLNDEVPGTDSSEDGHNMVEDSQSDIVLTEIRFVPENKDALEGMFESLAQCQVLHPDDDCQLSDDDFQDAEDGGIGDGFYQGVEGLEHLNEEGRINLERFNQMLQAGQGDAELTARTNQMNITNGHHDGGAHLDGQFQDADTFEDGQQ